MKRLDIAPRQGWQQRVEAQGFTFHSNGERPDGDTASNWYEGACWEFTLAEIETIEAATAELYRLSLAAVDHVVSHDLLAELNIPPAYRSAVRKSWQRGDPSLYGRFDLAFNGGEPKLLEFNADTPTTLIESAIVQWYWLKDVATDNDQFNSLHERLVDRWREIGARLPAGTTVYFSSIKDNREEFSTVEYLRDTAVQAGLSTEFIYIEDVGFLNGRMVDLSNRLIRCWFKLYPWEWLARENFGPALAACLDRIGVLEPPWKMILSNKGILPILWQLFPGHPNLLPAYRELRPDIQSSFVAKPMLGREGKNITLHGGGRDETIAGPYADEPKVFQRMADLARDGEMWSVIGSWVVGDHPAGMCVREDTSPIIVAGSRIVPHLLRG